MPKIFVIGIDGATWNLLNPMIEKNKMQNILKIKKEHISARLVSTIPPATGTAWPSFATGCFPNKHGIFDFVKIQKNQKTSIATSHDINVPTIFEYLDFVGKKSIIINHPLMYNLKLKNGMIFADFLSPKIYAYPKSAEKYLDDYRIFWDRNKLSRATSKEITEDIIDVEKKRLKLTLKLIKNEWDIFFVLFSGTDWISHKYFSEMEHMTERGTTAFKVFEFVDNAIGEIIEHIDRETILLIMSDHGFCSKKYSFNINQWLVSNGFLKYQRTKEKKEFDALNKLRNIQVEQNKENIHLSMRIKNKIKKIIFDMLIDLNIFKKYTIDWNSSLADIPTHNCFGIYINKNNVTDYEIFIDQLVEKMKDVIHLTTGEKVFKFVETTKKIYGKKPPDAPDILFLLHNDFSHRCVTNYTNREKPTIFSQVHGDDHSLFGIFLAYGPNITPSKLDTINIIDIAPTILNLMMYDAPPHMDGKSFFRQIYTADVPELKTLKDITRNKEDKTYLEKEKIKEQIKSLKL